MPFRAARKPRCTRRWLGRRLRNNQKPAGTSVREQESTQERSMSDVLNQSPNAAAQPSESNAGVVLNGHYMAPPQDKDGKIWVRATALVQDSPENLYAMWRDIESAPKWQEMITDVISTGPKSSHWVMNADGKNIEWDSEIL